MKIKSLALLASSVFVISSVALGSIAYLTSSDINVNTFTVGRVSMQLTEAAVTPDGKVIEGADRVKGNAYHLIPGTTYVKDPTVTIEKGSEESYVRLLVTINKMSELRAIFGDDFLPQEFVTGWDSSVWPCASITENGDNSATYEFRYRSGESKTISSSGADADVHLLPLFTHLNYPTTITSEQNAMLQELQITVIAQAIQATGFTDTDENGVTKSAEDNAWASFAVQHPAAEENTPESGDQESNPQDPGAGA